MKNEFYSRSFLFFILLALFYGGQSYAQCSCSGGVPANQLTYYSVLDTTDAASSTISFPKFNPTIGNLQCVVFNDTMSGISTTGIKNLVTDTSAPYYNIYRFFLSVSNDISGPGISVNESFSRTYGPDTLQRLGFPGDSTTHGPDMIFYNSTHQTSTGTVSPYLGSSGTVDFVYTLNGGLIALQGGLNYNSHIQTNYWGTFRLTYYWCPTSLLATGLKNFYIAKNKNHVKLVWEVTNDDPGNTYVIESSTDGKSFHSIGTLKAAATGNSYAKYQFNYNAGNKEEGFRSFRIREIEASGLSSYSMIRTVLFEQDNVLSYQTSPNPASNMVNVFFYTPTSGHFTVELVNFSGQVLFRKDYRLSSQYNIHVTWPDKYAGGLYFLKVQDQDRQLQRISKLLIQ